MKSELITILETFNFPVFLQGSMSQDASYPSTFFTFWNNDSYDYDHFDNAPMGYVWDFDINLYSNDPQTVNETMPQVISALKENGWIVSGQGRDVPSDEATHTGRAITALYLDLGG